MQATTIEWTNPDPIKKTPQPVFTGRGARPLLLLDLNQQPFD